MPKVRITMMCEKCKSKIIAFEQSYITLHALFASKSGGQAYRETYYHTFCAFSITEEVPTGAARGLTPAAPDSPNPLEVEFREQFSSLFCQKSRA